MKRNRRVFESKINCKSLSCAPINELGVVYLFGMLHDAFDFKIESIQAGFPDCIARRYIGSGRWEELRIEFEFKSRTFLQHKHNPDSVDIIVCWEHNWPECPEQIEIIELSSLMGKIEDIAKEVKEPKRLSAYNEFCRDKRLEGLTFPEIATLWKRHPYTKSEKNQKTIKNVLSDWQQFCRNKRLEGKTFSEIGKLWQMQRSKRNTHGD